MLATNGWKWGALPILVSVGLLALMVPNLTSQPVPAKKARNPTPITHATISPVVPTEVVDGDGAPVPVEVTALPIQFFDDLSWRSFLALNWPARPDVRGEPDTQKTLQDVTARRVWETWKADYEAFQPGGTPPTEWTSFDAVTPCVDIPFSGGGKPRLLAAFSKFGNLAEATFGLDTGTPLVAQNRTYTRYEVRVNRAEYDFIRDRKLYLRETLNQLKEPLRFTPGSIEIKAAWRELKSAEVEAARKRYYVIDAKVMNPVKNDTCEDRFMALVGLHIVQKTPLRPQWVWSTFEHIDNVPDHGTAHPIGTFSYNDPNAPQRLIPPNEPPALSKTNPPVPDPSPMQVVREVAIKRETKDANQLYQKALAGTVWANYQLVMTQWPTKTVPENSSGSPFPQDSSQGAVGSTVAETYHQTDSSCMDCHDIARDRRKTDFVWFVNLRAQPPDPELFRQINREFRAIKEKRTGKKEPAITVVGKNGPHQWAIPGDSTKDHISGTKIGDPVNRMQVPVANGDIVAFTVESGTHRVIFENAKSEQANGVWEIVAGSGSLEKLPDGKLPNFNHDEAMNSAAGTGALIQIKIKKLDPGKAILFACNPHSDTKIDVEMVGAIVAK